MNKTHIYRFSDPAEKVAAIMANPDFHVEFDGTRDDIAGTRMLPSKESGDITEFVMLTQEYKRALTGLDRSRSTEGRTDFRWNATTRTLDWNYISGEEPKRIKVCGQYRVEDEGSGSRLVHDYTIEIKIPLVGGKVSKIVDKEFIKSFPKFEKMVRDWLAR